MTLPTQQEAARAFEQEILTYGRDASRVLQAVAAHPDSALLNAYAALTHLFRCTREGMALAEPYVLTALACDASSRRDALMVGALAFWHREDSGNARRLLSALIERFPEDLFAAKLLQILCLDCGDAPAMIEAMETVLPLHPESAVAHGMHAFALDQCGHGRSAERAARHALSLGADPWAHHALAHVLDRANRHAEGRAWMIRQADDWSRCSSFLYTHNWWHAALFCLALGDQDGALMLFDQRVWAVRKDYCQDQINAISLLARLELAGVDVGERWTEVAAHVRPRRFDAVSGFLDLHYAYALACAEDDEAVADLQRRAMAGNQASAPAWRKIMPAAIGGIVSFARGQDERAARMLGAVSPLLPILGGSSVQRDLFRRLLAAAQDGRRAAVRAA